MEIAKKILDHDQYVIFDNFTKLTKEHFNKRLKQENLASKNTYVLVRV